MARSRKQARRSGGSDGLPGWAWLMMGVVVTIAVIMIAPKYFKADHDGFFRPRPNPDAEPAPVTVADEAAVADDKPATDKKRSGDAADLAADKRKQDYDFYTLLPGKEVPVSDAEIAATERAEEERRQRREAEAMARSQAAASAAVDAVVAPAAATKPEPLPEPVVEAAASAEPRTASAPTATASSASTPAATATPKPAAKPVAASEPADDGTRYLLQAGAFQASGQAEELKARIALLGLGARVESAQIGSKTVYRVRMGPYGTAGDLAEAKRKLGNGGLAALAIKVK